MKKEKNLEKSIVEESIPVIGDDWQFVYKPQNDGDENSQESTCPNLMDKKSETAKIKYKEKSL